MSVQSVPTPPSPASECGSPLDPSGGKPRSFAGGWWGRVEGGKGGVVEGGGWKRRSCGRGGVL